MGMKLQTIPWYDVASLTAIYSRPQELESLEVISTPPQSTIITWPASARWMQPPADTLPNVGDAGAQFAAIVAERAGVQPRARWA
jgi:hypothetical protein